MSLSNPIKKVLKNALANISADILIDLAWELGNYTPVHGAGTSALGGFKLGSMKGNDNMYHVGIFPSNKKTLKPPPVISFAWTSEPTGEMILEGLISAIDAINKTHGMPKRPLLVGLANLDSAVGRKQFILASVEYLFSSTYESTDEMSISALLAYLNAAMPSDKHKDFDTIEMAHAVASMKAKGMVVFEGDNLRFVD